jgi:hypothetical protein
MFARTLVYTRDITYIAFLFLNNLCNCLNEPSRSQLSLLISSFPVKPTQLNNTYQSIKAESNLNQISKSKKINILNLKHQNYNNQNKSNKKQPIVITL